MLKNNHHRSLVRESGALGIQRSFAFRILSAATILLSFVTLLLLSDSVRAVELVSVDDRVDVSFTPLVVGQTAKDYSTDAVVKNTSLADILSPIRIVITSVDQANTSVANADGSTGGNAYIEISLPGGVLVPGESTSPASIVFARDTGNATSGSSGNGKTKNNNFPVFDFSTTVLGGAVATTSAPSSSPSVLPVNSGDIDVAFKVYLDGNVSAASNLLLVRQDNGNSYPLNDDGVSGDPVAGDDVYGVSVAINTDTLVAEQCIPFVSSAEVDGETVISSVYDLCVTSFPPSIVSSNTEPSNLVVNNDGDEAVSDELVVVFVDGTSEDRVVKTLDIYNAEVVGTLLRYGIYQVRLSESKTLKELERLIGQLKKRNEVADAYLNTIVEYSAVPNDANFSLQHGLTLINADDVWDIGATGSGVTITVIDSGVDTGHEELDAAGKVTDPTTGDPVFTYAGQGLTDSNNHGTPVAAIAAAETDNFVGIAGVAHDSLIESIKISNSTNPTSTEFLNALDMARQVGTGEIVNVSSNVYTIPSAAADNICQIVNDIVFDGTATPRKILINSAGNDGIATANAYPGRCNVDVPDPFGGPLRHTTLTNKSLLMPVANSISCDITDTTSCVPALVDTLFSTSNFGDWVDVAAPGTYLRTPQNGGGYDYGNGPDSTGSTPDDADPFTNPAGTSFSAPMVAGAAAILRSCGVALTDIETALSAGTLNDVDPGADVLPRIDLAEALGSVNSAPTGLSIDNTAIPELAEPSDTTTTPVTVGTLSTTDSNSCDAFVYTIAGGVDAASFQITDDELEVATGVELDFETKSSFDVTVRTTDFNGEIFDQPITVILNDVFESISGGTVLFDVDFEAFTVGSAPPFGAGSDRPTGADSNLTATVENSASVSPGAALPSGKFARLEESNGEAPNLFFDNGTAFTSGIVNITMDVLVETDDSYFVYVRNGSGSGSAPAAQSILNVDIIGTELRFTSYPQASIDFENPIITSTSIALGAAFNLELVFDLDAFTYDAYVDSVQVVSGAEFGTGRAPLFTDTYIGMLAPGFNFTSFDPQPSGFEGVMQIDNILMQHIVP